MVVEHAKVAKKDWSKTTVPLATQDINYMEQNVLLLNANLLLVDVKNVKIYQRELWIVIVNLVIQVLF